MTCLQSGPSPVDSTGPIPMILAHAHKRILSKEPCHYLNSSMMTFFRISSFLITTGFISFLASSMSVVSLLSVEGGQNLHAHKSCPAAWSHERRIEEMAESNNTQQHTESSTS